MTMLRSHWTILLILVLFLGLGCAYSVINPLFESPDEIFHYEYVRWLVEGHGLPRPEQVGIAPWHQEGSQPPLYYLVAALITMPIPTDNAAAVIRYNPHAAVGLPDAPGNKNIMVHGREDAWPWRGVALAAHVARFFSLLLGALTVVSAYGTARAIFPGQQALASLAAALVALNPQFLFISAAVNNDNLVIAASAAGLWLSIYLVGRYGSAAQARGEAERRGAWDPTGPKVGELLLLGFILGIAALAKLNGLVLAAVGGLALVLLAWRHAVPFRTLVIWGLITGAAMLATAGWWYGRNLALYGDPLGLKAMFDILPRRALPPTPAELLARAQGVWRSAWGVFGWFNVAAQDWFYGIYTILSLVGLAGWIIANPLRQLFARAARRRSPNQLHHETRASRRSATAVACRFHLGFSLEGSAGREASIGISNPRLRDPRPLQLSLLVLWVLLVLLALVTWAQMRYPQGRLLFPAISAAAVLLAAGLLGWLPRRLHDASTALVGIGLAALAAFAPVWWIMPAYAAPQLLPGGARVPNALSADFGGQVRLVGYELERTQVQRGDTLHLTLYWEALRPPDADYSVFVHLVDEYDITQAQHDSYPAKGSLPTSEWPAGAIIPDAHPVQIPAIVPAPQQLRVEVGVYRFSTGERLLVEGRDSRVLGTVTVAPRSSEQGKGDLLHINFGDQIALTGFNLDRRVLRPGDSLELTLQWEALDRPKADYTAFAHLVLPPGTVWAGDDRLLQDGPAGTTQWRLGQRVEERYHLSLPAEAPAGVYFVEIGLYESVTMDRLTVNGSDAGVVLGYVRVE